MSRELSGQESNNGNSGGSNNTNNSKKSIHSYGFSQQLPLPIAKAPKTEFDRNFPQLKSIPESPTQYKLAQSPLQTPNPNPSKTPTPTTQHNPQLSSYINSESRQDDRGKSLSQSQSRRIADIVSGNGTSDKKLTKNEIEKNERMKIEQEFITQKKFYAQLIPNNSQNKSYNSETRHVVKKLGKMEIIGDSSRVIVQRKSDRNVMKEETIRLESHRSDGVVIESSGGEGMRDENRVNVLCGSSQWNPLFDSGEDVLPPLPKEYEESDRFETVLRQMGWDPE
uniref:Uncharacterized protein n=1 Tax=Timspurckia oligopyrenoides TaxID=708627 RepID=A0A7S0ZBR8_9RHOD|mmetsp:Transcript_11596/g.20972  ORF Transcript_11596/g.20972 Transcript_11596/m.20972 type:complete len:281 (+) Transcript_11596:52-894(+)